jgi:hypothetical protein
MQKGPKGNPLVAIMIGKTDLLTVKGGKSERRKNSLPRNHKNASENDIGKISKY